VKCNNNLKSSDDELESELDDDTELSFDLNDLGEWVITSDEEPNASVQKKTEAYSDDLVELELCLDDETEAETSSHPETSIREEIQHSDEFIEEK